MLQTSPITLQALSRETPEMQHRYGNESEGLARLIGVTTDSFRVAEGFAFVARSVGGTLFNHLQNAFRDLSQILQPQGVIAMRATPFFPTEKAEMETFLPLSCHEMEHFSFSRFGDSLAAIQNTDATLGVLALAVGALHMTDDQLALKDGHFYFRARTSEVSSVTQMSVRIASQMGGNGSAPKLFIAADRRSSEVISRHMQGTMRKQPDPRQIKSLLAALSHIDAKIGESSIEGFFSPDDHRPIITRHVNLKSLREMPPLPNVPRRTLRLTERMAAIAKSVPFPRFGKTR